MWKWRYLAVWQSAVSDSNSTSIHRNNPYEKDVGNGEK